MPYVQVPKDLNKVKTKVVFNLTKRQLIWFSAAAVTAVPVYFLTRSHIGNTLAMLLLIIINAIDSDELDGTGVVADTTEPLEERIQHQLMIEKILEGIAILSDKDKELVDMLYFKGMSERQITAITGVPQTTLNYRRRRILKNLSKFFEN